MSDVRPPSGTQWTLSAHDQELVVVESGGGIRSYRVGGEDVLFGYDEAASIAKQALKEGRTIREVVIDRGHVADGKLTEQQLDEALDVLAMAYPHGRG